MTAPTIDEFFDFKPTGQLIDDLDTPIPVIDIDVVDRNLKRWQQRCDDAGLANRPHIKTHKIAALAKYQLALGAKGITVQKLGEAEAMADAGITDMLLTYNAVGPAKLKRLAGLARRTDIKVVADSAAVVEGLALAALAAGRTISVLVECDTGMMRNGVQSPAAAAELAKLIDSTAGLSYGGLMTYPKPGIREQTANFLAEARNLAANAGLETAVISTGGSPEMWRDSHLSIATEYRAGTYVYYDRALVSQGACSLEDCAATVLATVVSTPTSERAMIDAGSKSLTSDLLGLKGYGIVQELGQAPLYNLNEEHGYLDVSQLNRKPQVGERLRITPNHACAVMNMFNAVVFVRGEEVLGQVAVDARGKVQ